MLQTPFRLLTKANEMRGKEGQRKRKKRQEEERRRIETETQKRHKKWHLGKKSEVGE